MIELAHFRSLADEAAPHTTFPCCPTPRYQ
jgi:hypothetical protein